MKTLEDIFKGRKSKSLLIILILAILFLIRLTFYVENLSSFMSQKSSKENFLENELNNFLKPNKFAFKGEKIVHIDLKGAPPKISYYKHFFKLLVKLGATGIIIEYEDMFPYHGILSNIPALNAYTLNDIKIINDLAHKMHLKIIPLVQTFGHMEFILKLEEWKHLREVPKYPSVICPLHNETLILLKELIEQIITAHPHSNIIHIGADEVYSIGVCNKCFLAMNKHRWTKQEFFLHHVSTVANMIKKKHPDMRILVWDDEFRSVKQEDLENSKIATLVEPVVWKYTRDVLQQLGSNLFDIYADIFPKIWIATAFKGATGSNKFVTDIAYHLDNHRSWMQIVENYSGKLKFEGIIMTGWQRYDHFAILCELLPVGIPSLALNLYLIQGLYEDPGSIPPKAIGNILQCEYPYSLVGLPNGTPKCSYLGGNLLEGVLKLQQLKQDFTNLLDMSSVVGWMSDYNINNAYSNVIIVETAMKDLNMYKMELMEIETEIIVSMNKIYDNYTITEFSETYIVPLNNKIDAVWHAREKLLVKETWPRRPFISQDAN